MSTSRLWELPNRTLQKRKIHLIYSCKFFVFLHEQRHRISDEQMERKLSHGMPIIPRRPSMAAAMLAIASLLQCYEQKSDETAPFSLDTLCDFRHRLIRHNMDEVLLEHTVDMDTKLILAACVRPANEPEYKAAEWLRPKVPIAG